MGEGYYLGVHKNEPPCFLMIFTLSSFSTKQFQQVVPIHAAHLYDAVMVFARALNATIFSSEGNVRNGRDLVAKIQRTSFKSELCTFVLRTSTLYWKKKKSPMFNTVSNFAPVYHSPMLLLGIFILLRLKFKYRLRKGISCREIIFKNMEEVRPFADVFLYLLGFIARY